ERERTRKDREQAGSSQDVRNDNQLRGSRSDCQSDYSRGSRDSRSTRYSRGSRDSWRGNRSGARNQPRVVEGGNRNQPRTEGPFRYNYVRGGDNNNSSRPRESSE